MVNEKTVNNPFNFYAIDCFESWKKLESDLTIAICFVWFGLITGMALVGGATGGFWVSAVLLMISFVAIIRENGLSSLLFCVLPTVVIITTLIIFGLDIGLETVAILSFALLLSAVSMSLIPASLVRYFIGRLS